MNNLSGSPKNLPMTNSIKIEDQPLGGQRMPLSSGSQNALPSTTVSTAPTSSLSPSLNVSMNIKTEPVSPLPPASTGQTVIKEELKQVPADVKLEIKMEVDSSSSSATSMATTVSTSSNSSVKTEKTDSPQPATVKTETKPKEYKIWTKEEFLESLLPVPEKGKTTEPELGPFLDPVNPDQLGIPVSNTYFLEILILIEVNVIQVIPSKYRLFNFEIRYLIFENINIFKFLFRTTLRLLKIQWIFHPSKRSLIMGITRILGV